MSEPARRLSREEGKLITRHRLLQAGTDLLLQRGYDGLTTGRIATRAGIAQPSFYVHFKDRDELLKAIATGVVEQLRRSLNDVRSRLRLGGDIMSVARDTYRLSLEAIVRNADLLKLMMAERYRPRSSIGSCARTLMAEVTGDLVEDLARAGATASIPRERLPLICESLITLALQMGLAMAEEHDRDIDTVTDILSKTTVAMLLSAVSDG